MARRPRIGVTGPDSGGTAAWLFTALSILVQGGIPIRIRPSAPHSTDRLDGLVVGGGADVDPETYESGHVLEKYLNQSHTFKERPFYKKVLRFFRFLLYSFIARLRKLFSRKSHKLDRDRDQLEFGLVDRAVKAGLPVLGICRGAQLINIYFRGDLHQEIDPFYLEEPNPTSVLPVKRVLLEKGSKLARIYKRDELFVNALHHQAVDTPGQHIKVVAREPNGVVQAIESEAHPFVLGVQWHPEYLLNRALHRKIFRALVKEAARKSTRQPVPDALR